MNNIPNKGKLEDALSWQSNMISITYHSCDMHIYMKEKIAKNALIVDDDVSMEAILVYKV